MPVLDTERRSATRNALRYRPIDTDQATAGPVVSRAHRSRSDARVTTAPVEPDDLEEEEKRVPQRRSVAPAPRARTWGRFHPLFFVGLGLLATILLWTGITQAIIWGTNELNNLKYGTPRTFQIDAVVGQNDSASHPSHFLAVNLRDQIEILEWPGGNAAQMRVYLGPQLVGPGSDQDVVTLQFIDLAKNGKPDMIINVDNMQYILINDHGTFRQPTSTEQQQLQTLLQQSEH